MSLKILIKAGVLSLKQFLYNSFAFPEMSLKVFLRMKVYKEGKKQFSQYDVL